jgi:hypothetical protein
VFALLARLPLAGRRVVVPLSYGDAVYRDAVIALGRRLFGDRFVPIVEYMPLERYNAVLADCSIAVMGHRRQQGLGNIGTMMLMGARVFIDPASTAYRHFVSRGAVVSPLADLAAGDPTALAPLTADEQAVNREVLDRVWGSDTVRRNVHALVSRLGARAAA